jgi:hypothetical protein
MPGTAQTAVAVIGIDIGKNSFHIVGLDNRGAIVLRQKWSRGQVEARLANMSPCLIGMEACVGAHHLSRKLKALGHGARLMPAKYVRPYSKGQKNDFRDAEAVQRPTMKFVATKTAEQLDLQALHRVRERLVSQRTGVVNQIRAFLLERGVAVRQGLRGPRRRPVAVYPSAIQLHLENRGQQPGERPIKTVVHGVASLDRMIERGKIRYDGLVGDARIVEGEGADEEAITSNAVCVRRMCGRKQRQCGSPPYSSAPCPHSAT